MSETHEWLPRTLLVDDSPSRRLRVERMLTGKGYSVQSVGDGAHALALIRSADPGTRPELVVSDVNMPILDGVKLARKLGDDPELEGVAIILYTGCRKEAREAAERLSIEKLDYMKTAVEFEHLETAITTRTRALRTLRRLARVRANLSGPPGK